MKICLRRDVETAIEKPRRIVGHRLGPAPRRVVAAAVVQSPVGMELSVEERHEPFDFDALLEERFFLGCVFDCPVIARLGGNGDAIFGQLLALARLGPVGAVADQVSAESVVEQRMEAVDIVAVARDVNEV